MADFLVGYHTPLGREYLANLVTGLLVEVMTNSISANSFAGMAPECPLGH